MKRMNLGCGPVQPVGWDNADADPTWRVPFIWAPEHGPGKMMNATRSSSVDWQPVGYDLIVANHVLQMVEWQRLVLWLSNVRNALRPGGVLRLLVPDFEAAFAAFERGERAWFPIADDHEASVDGKLCMYLTQAGATRSLFTEKWLIELCHRAGFADAHALEYGGSCLPAEYGPTELDSREGESLIVEART